MRQLLKHSSLLLSFLLVTSRRKNNNSRPEDRIPLYPNLYRRHTGTTTQNKAFGVTVLVWFLVRTDFERASSKLPIFRFFDSAMAFRFRFRSDATARCKPPKQIEANVPKVAHFCSYAYNTTFRFHVRALIKIREFCNEI